MNDVIYANGIDIDTATYAIPPMSVEQLDALIRGEQSPENFNELRARAGSAKATHLGVKEGVDPKSLEQSGWGVIFADDADPAIERALQPLLKLRADQAGKRFRNYSGTKAFQIGADNKNKFLARYGAGPGPADPERVPYYLLIVGSPEKISYTVQSQLDVQYAVGRIHFDTPAEYAAYAESVVAAESGKVKLPRQAAFFGVTHPAGDPATDQSLAYLINPLVKGLGQTPGWSFESVLGSNADKAALRGRLGGSQTPALLFSASHGLKVAPDNKRARSQAEYQGALLCADWPGPGTPFEDEAFYFSGRDLAKDANLHGLIALFFACFGAGTPQFDAYSQLERIRLGQDAGPALQLAPQPFVSYLPRKMLSAPAGGALAVLGHVERTWPSSYLWLRQEDGSVPPQIAAFEGLVKRLMDGYPVGAAVEYLNQRYAELTTMLKEYLEGIQFGDSYNQADFANTWMAANDAQWYTIIGDPAVRLPIVDQTDALPRPVRISTAATATTEETQPHQQSIAVQPPVVATSTAEQPHTAKETAMTTLPDDPRFANSFTPPPAPTRDLVQLKADHRELYDAYVQQVQDGYEKSTRVFEDVRRAFMRSHTITLIMYVVLFLLGVGTVITGIVLAVQGNTTSGIIFLGVGFAAFVTYFIGRSTLSVEENLLYITWLGVIYNSYWTHLAWATERKTAQDELTEATNAAIKQLERLVNRHALSARKRPSLQDITQPATPDAAQDTPATPPAPSAPAPADPPSA
jgi:hypothetical protein